MPTKAELVTEAQNRISDSSYSAATILTYLNRGLNRVAGTVPLPDLEAWDDISTHTATLAGTGIAFVDSDPDTITDAGNGFVTAGFMAGDTVSVSGTTNNEDFSGVIASVTAGTITLNNAASVTAESAGESFTLTARGPRVALPANFQPGFGRKSLVHCRSIDHNRPIKIYDSPIHIVRKMGNLDTAGVVTAVAENGPYLFYQNVPSTSENLRIFYHRKPAEMVDDTDTPDGLSNFDDDLVYDLLAGFAAWRIFTLIEKSADGPGESAKVHKADFLDALAALSTYVGPHQTEPVEVVDGMEWDNQWW